VVWTQAARKSSRKFKLGHEFVTTDRAFKQFKGLKLHVLEKA
jgi:hypothetical protein